MSTVTLLLIWTLALLFTSARDISFLSRSLSRPRNQVVLSQPRFVLSFGLHSGACRAAVLSPFKSVQCKFLIELREVCREEGDIGRVLVLTSKLA